jgi:antitoxin (DNA-binding transcriptional repressor) of toxin-antitoxin stability system
MRMGLREANQNFSKAIKAIKSGKVITLTERGKAIATITPIADETTEGDELQPLRDEGFLVGRRKNGVITAKVKPYRTAGLSVSGILRKERDED